MKNITIAKFGIASYLLSIYASQTNSEGISIAPVFIIIISGIATFLFTFLAIIRIWNISKFISILFAISSAIFFGMEAMQDSLSLANGTSLIFILNMNKLVNLLTRFYVIFLLWINKNYIKSV